METSDILLIYLAIINLTSIVKNRMSNKVYTFCAFVDFKNAFDCINREYLLYNELFKSIKGLYNELCIKINNMYT